MRRLLCPLPVMLFLSFQARGNVPVTFGDTLYAKFQHPRCLQCHQFNSHRNHGRSFHSHRSRYLCDSCHTPYITGLARGEWMAPNERMDYTGMGAVETCQLIKRNLGVGDTRGKMAHHLLQGGRVRWAVDNGMTPAGRFPTMPGAGLTPSYL